MGYTMDPLSSDGDEHYSPQLPLHYRDPLEKHATGHESILKTLRAICAVIAPQNAFPIQIKGQVRLVGSAR